MPNIDDTYKHDVFRSLAKSGESLTAEAVSLLVFVDPDIAEYMTPVVRRILNKGTTYHRVIRDNSTMTVRYKAGPTLLK